MKTETWKPIAGYEGIYEVSDLGRVKSLRRQKKHVARSTGKVTIGFTKERILKQNIDSMGYVHYRLRKNGKSTLFKGHHLVAQAFLRIRQ